MYWTMPSIFLHASSVHDDRIAAAGLDDRWERRTPLTASSVTVEQDGWGARAAEEDRQEWQDGGRLLRKVRQRTMVIGKQRESLVEVI
jgi:hypothetical protein